MSLHHFLIEKSRVNNYTNNLRTIFSFYNLNVYYFFVKYLNILTLNYLSVVSFVNNNHSSNQNSFIGNKRNYE